MMHAQENIAKHLSFVKDSLLPKAASTPRILITLAFSGFVQLSFDNSIHVQANPTCDLKFITAPKQASLQLVKKYDKCIFFVVLTPNFKTSKSFAYVLPQ